MKKLLTSIALIAILIPNISFVSAETQMATVVNPETGERKAVEIGDPHAFDDGFILEYSYYQDEEEIAPEDRMLGYTAVTDYDTTVNVPMNASQDYVPVSSLETPDGHTLTTSDVTRGFLMVEPGKRKQEIIMCTGINATTSRWTTCTRGLAFYGKSLASVSANIQTHSVGSRVILSNVHQVYDQFVNKDDDQTIGGDKTYTGQTDFSNYLPTSTSTYATENTQLITFSQLNAVTNQGAATGTETTQGIWEGATQTEMASSTAVGGTGNLVLQSKYASSTCEAGGICIPTTENDGKLNQGIIDLSETFTFTGDINSTGDTYLASTSFSQIPTASGTPANDDDLITKEYYESHYPQRFLDANPFNFRDGVTSNIAASASYWGTTTPGFEPDYFEVMFTVALSDEYWNYSSAASVDIETWYIFGSARQNKITYIKDVFSTSMNPSSYVDDSFDVMMSDQGSDLVYGEGTWDSTGVSSLSVSDGTLSLELATSSTELIFKFEYSWISDGGAIDIDCWHLKVFE